MYSYDAAVDSADPATTGPRVAARASGRDAGLGQHAATRAIPRYVFHGANPLSFRRWLARGGHCHAPWAETAASLLFVNAWNEWAEGAHLEPDARFGRAYLEAFETRSESPSG